MYVKLEKNELEGLPVVATIVSAVATAAAPSINDWIRKQLGLKTEAEIRSEELAKAYETQKYLAELKLAKEMELQKIMVIGGLVIGGIALYSILTRRK